MAIFHLSVKIISRGKGKSAVAAAAYRSGEKITSDYDGITHDYTRKRGVVMTEILLPRNAPILFYNRSRLWNAVEKIEKAKNAQLAREVEVSIPKELNFEEGYHLVKEFCQRNFVDEGMIADICFHDKGDGNPHAHIMLTVRPFNEDRSWGNKQKKVYILDENGEKIYDKKKRQYKCKSVPTTDWNDRGNVEKWRKSWANMCNRYLEKSGYDEIIDHRSYERQGLEILPTKHLGTAASQMEKRNIKTERGEFNRHIKMVNKMIRFYNEEIAKLKKEAIQLAKNVKDKVIKVARNLEQLRKNILCTVYAEKDNDKKMEQFQKLIPRDMNVIKTAYDLIRKQERLKEEKQAYANVINAKKEKKKQKEQAVEALRAVQMELYRIDRQLRELPQFYKMYSIYEMEECIENEERYEKMISRLEKMADKIERNKAITYLEYDIAKDKVEPEDREAVAEERNKIRPEMEQKAKEELEDMYGIEFDGYLFEDAVEETDELLEGKGVARAEEIKVDKDIVERNDHKKSIYSIKNLNKCFLIICYETTPSLLHLIVMERV